MKFDREAAKRLWLDGWSERDTAYALGVSRKRIRTIRKHADDGERSRHKISAEIRRAEIESDVSIRRLDHLETYRSAKKHVRTHRRVGLKAHFDAPTEERITKMIQKEGSP